MPSIKSSAEVDVRYSFTAQYLCASAIFARRCEEIEKANNVQPHELNELVRTEHRGLVTAAIMQSAAAVEAESAEITMHGPWHHLGSTGADPKVLSLLKGVSDVIDDQPVLERYEVILHLLGKEKLPEGEQPVQDMDTLVRFRNEIIHYKSKWGKEMSREKLFKTLQHLRLARPPFVDNNQNFFPDQLLGAACARWAVKTGLAFIAAVYKRLDIASPLDAYLEQFAGL